MGEGLISITEDVLFTPAIIFILNRKGVVLAKLYEATYKKRPPAKLVIETLDKLAEGGAGK